MIPKLKLVALFFGPSINGGATTVVAALALVAEANYSYVVKSGLLYNALLGAGTPYNTMQSSNSAVSALHQTVFSNPMFNKLLFYGMWLLAGLCIYGFIMLFRTSLMQEKSELQQLQYIHARRSQIEHDLVLRTAIRLTGLLIGLTLIWLFINFLFPFCVLAARVGLDKLSLLNGWLFLLLGLVVMIMTLHIFIVILRIIFFKPRLFGGWDSSD